MALAAEALLRKGVGVTVLCSEATDSLPEGCTLQLLPVRGCSNHARMAAFEKQARLFLQKNHFDVAVGFSRMSGLDIYFAADDCLRCRWKNPLLNSCLMRRKIFLQQEQAALQSPLILTLTGRQERDYQFYYALEKRKFRRLPPGISANYRQIPDRTAAKKIMTDQYNIDPEKILIVQVAASFYTKGVDRSLAILSSLPTEWREKITFLAAGDDKNRHRYQRVAEINGIDARFPGGCDHVEQLLAAGDLLLHPARAESAGNVLIEALCCNLPILTTRRCGYAEYVESSGGGVVLPETFELDHWLLAMKKLLTEPEHLRQCRKNTENFSRSDFWFSRPDVIAGEVINFARNQGA